MHLVYNIFPNNSWILPNKNVIFDFAKFPIGFFTGVWKSTVLFLLNSNSKNCVVLYSSLYNMKYKKQVQGNSVVNVLLTIYNIIGFCETPSTYCFFFFIFFSCCFKIVDQQSMSHSIIKIIHFEYMLNCIYVG